MGDAGGRCLLLQPLRDSWILARARLLVHSRMIPQMAAVLLPGASRQTRAPGGRGMLLLSCWSAAEQTQALRLSSPLLRLT